MKNTDQDIDEILHALRRVEQIASGQIEKNDDDRTRFLAQSMETMCKPISELLEELKERRYNSASSQDSGHLAAEHARILVEGFSDESAAQALVDALDKATHYYSELVDVSISLRQLNELREGGHRATLELHITPLNLKNRAHIEGLDVENLRFRQSEFQNQLDYEAKETRHRVFDHFVPVIGARASLIPDYLLINVNDAYLMNYMIEKDFFKAGSKQSKPNSPSHILVRTRIGPEPEPE